MYIDICIPPRGFASCGSGAGLRYPSVRGLFGVTQTEVMLWHDAEELKTPGPWGLGAGGQSGRGVYPAESCGWQPLGTLG